MREPSMLSCYDMRGEHVNLLSLGREATWEVVVCPVLDNPRN